MQTITNLCEGFINIFAVAAEYWTGLVTGIVPMVLMMITVFNAIMALVGQKRIEKVAQALAKVPILSYTLLPIIASIFLGNPMNNTVPKFLKQRNRVGYWEGLMPLSVPLLHLFPHTNPAEYYLWWGIASGVAAAGYSLNVLCIRLFIYAFIIAIIRSMLSEFIWVFLAKREGLTELINK